MTARVVPLDSPEASDSRVGGSAADRLRLLSQLSMRAWALTKRPLPRYTRSTMPITITVLGARPDRD